MLPASWNDVGIGMGLIKLPSVCSVLESPVPSPPLPACCARFSLSTRVSLVAAEQLALALLRAVHGHHALAPVLVRFIRIH